MRLHVAELGHRLEPQLGVLLALRRLEQTVLLAGDHEGAQDAALHVDVGRRGVDLGQDGAASGPPCTPRYWIAWLWSSGVDDPLA